MSDSLVGNKHHEEGSSLMKYLQIVLFPLILFVLIAGCAPIMQPPLEPMGSGSSGAASGKYVPKVDNFQVILDTSLSMIEDGNYFLPARAVVSRINQGIPTDLKYNGGLRSFGHNSYQSTNPTDLVYGMTSHTRSGFHDGLASIRYAGGPSPLAAALEAAGNDLKMASGSTALIIVSDGLFMDDVPAAAKNLKEKMGDSLCIYTIGVGNRNNGAGHDLLQKVAEAGQCGFATTDAALADDAKMAAFIENVFLAKPVAAKPVSKVMPPGDRDGDGVTDDKDKCPNTQKGEFVDEDGCTLKMTLHINFDFDKAEIKPEFKHDLDKAATYIQKHSYVPYILIAGHTDHSGSLEYNQKLSEDRANAVRQYLISTYGIDGKRLFAKGHGKLKPVAANTTKEGRYQNRRVEVICCAMKPM